MSNSIHGTSHAALALLTHSAAFEGKFIYIPHVHHSSRSLGAARCPAGPAPPARTPPGRLLPAQASRPRSVAACRQMALSTAASHAAAGIARSRQSESDWRSTAIVRVYDSSRTDRTRVSGRNAARIFASTNMCHLALTDTGCVWPSGTEKTVYANELHSALGCRSRSRAGRPSSAEPRSPNASSEPAAAAAPSQPGRLPC